MKPLTLTVPIPSYKSGQAPDHVAETNIHNLQCLGDGYVFKDPSRKQAALLGIIKVVG